MDGTDTKGCIAIAGIAVVYGIYACSNPGADGIVFGSVIAAVAGLGGWMLKGISVSKASKGH